MPVTPEPASGDRAAAAKLFAEESPGSMEARCRVTPGRGGDALRESATENKPPSPEGKGEKVR